MWVNVKWDDIRIGNKVRNEKEEEFLVTWNRRGALGGGETRNTRFWYADGKERELRYQRWEDAE